MVMDKTACVRANARMSSRCSVTPEGSTLTLLRLRPADSGTYTCLAASPAGQESRIYTLFVLGQWELSRLLRKHSPAPVSD